MPEPISWNNELECWEGTGGSMLPTQERKAPDSILLDRYRKELTFALRTDTTNDLDIITELWEYKRANDEKHKALERIAAYIAREFPTETGYILEKCTSHEIADATIMLVATLKKMAKV